MCKKNSGRKPKNSIYLHSEGINIQFSYEYNKSRPSENYPRDHY